MPTEPLECVCGWKGTREQCCHNPRQGWLTCPRCWHAGYDRIPDSPENMERRRREMDAEIALMPTTA